MKTESLFADVGAVAISLERLTKRFPGSSSAAVDGLTLDIPAGGIVARGFKSHTCLHIRAGLANWRTRCPAKAEGRVRLS